MTVSKHTQALQMTCKRPVLIIYITNFVAALEKIFFQLNKNNTQFLFMVSTLSFICRKVGSFQRKAESTDSYWNNSLCALVPKKLTFAGMLLTTEYIHICQYRYPKPAISVSIFSKVHSNISSCTQKVTWINNYRVYSKTCSVCFTKFWEVNLFYEVLLSH